MDSNDERNLLVIGAPDTTRRQPPLGVSGAGPPDLPSGGRKDVPRGLVPGVRAGREGGAGGRAGLLRGAGDREARAGAGERREATPRPRPTSSRGPGRGLAGLRTGGFRGLYADELRARGVTLSPTGSSSPRGRAPRRQRRSLTSRRPRGRSKGPAGTPSGYSERPRFRATGLVMARGAPYERAAAGRDRRGSPATGLRRRRGTIAAGGRGPPIRTTGVADPCGRGRRSS